MELEEGGKHCSHHHPCCCPWILASYFIGLNSHLNQVTGSFCNHSTQLWPTTEQRNLLIVQTTHVWLPTGSFLWNSSALLSEKNHSRPTRDTSMPSGGTQHRTQRLCQTEVWRLNFSREEQPAMQTNKITNQEIQPIKYVSIKFTVWCRWNDRSMLNLYILT